MGIYPDEHWEKGSVVRNGVQIETVVNYYRLPGVTQVRVFEMVTEMEIRDSCYCCSCGEREGTDAACRNHGWAAQRPCELHGMPGQPWDWDFDLPECSNQMPDSVQVERARRAEIESRY